MVTLEGIATSAGIAIGPAQLLTPRLVVVDRWVLPAQVNAEVARLVDATAATDRHLIALADQLQGPQRESRLIIDAHRLMLHSEEILGSARQLIAQEHLAAECAVRRVVRDVVKIFDTMRDRYLQERGEDVEAIGDRLIGTLLGVPQSWSSPQASLGALGVGMALSPYDAFQLQRCGLAGVATEQGGKTSHGSIIVRGFGLPCVVGVARLGEQVAQGDWLIVDGTHGRVTVNPDHATLQSAREAQRVESARARRLLRHVRRSTVTLDGTRIELAANIETLSEVKGALSLGAESVGLFRTELQYLDRRDLPSEDEQYRDAVATLAMLRGRTATFRTLDLGGDKLPFAIELPPGANPNLGVRAIRFSLLRPDIFRTQLRALYRASAHGPLRIMFPLVSGSSELEQAVEICASVREALEREGLAFNRQVALGAMLETPSAMLTADHLADHCDFFSVGTNDLIQYVFAADRDNPDVSRLYQPLHPALLRLLARAVDAAAAAGRPISICGDMAADPAYTWVLLGLGFRQLSMAPRAIANVKALIDGTRLSDAQQLVRELADLRSDAQTTEHVQCTMERFLSTLEHEPLPRAPQVHGFVARVHRNALRAAK